MIQVCMFYVWDKKDCIQYFLLKKDIKQNTLT